VDAGQLQLRAPKGDPGSVLGALYAALPSVPLELNPRLGWSEWIDLSWLRPSRSGWSQRLLGSSLARLARLLPSRSDGEQQSHRFWVDYALEPRNGELTITGSSRQRDGAGTPLLHTRARFTHTRGLESVELRSESWKVSAMRVAPREAYPEAARESIGLMPGLTRGGAIEVSSRGACPTRGSMRHEGGVS
jgi:hypothetical protein